MRSNGINSFSGRIGKWSKWPVTVCDREGPTTPTTSLFSCATVCHLHSALSKDPLNECWACNPSACLSHLWPLPCRLQSVRLTLWQSDPVGLQLLWWVQVCGYRCRGTRHWGISGTEARHRSRETSCLTWQSDYSLRGPQHTCCWLSFYNRVWVSSCFQFSPIMFNTSTKLFQRLLWLWHKLRLSSSSFDHLRCPAVRCKDLIGWALLPPFTGQSVPPPLSCSSSFPPDLLCGQPCFSFGEFCIH